MKLKGVLGLALVTGVLLSIVMANTVNAFAVEVEGNQERTIAEVEIEPLSDDVVTYAVEGGNIYFNTSTKEITDCDESVTSAVIPSEINGVAVTTIGYKAFYGCINLTSVEIPNSVTNIDHEAFFNCSSLTSIELPNSITEIGMDSFSCCKSLTSIKIPDGVEKIRKNTFSSCVELTSVELPNSVTSIGENAFSRCKKLTNINFPSNLKEINKSAFFYCISLTEVELGDSITMIDEEAFSECRKLKSIKIPSSITSIKCKAFMNCWKITQVEIPNSVTSIEEKAFYQCKAIAEVFYSGSEEEWNNISVAADNELLTSAKIYYNSRIPVIGDADCDGEVTQADIGFVLAKALNNEYVIPMEAKGLDYMKYIDIDGDSYITATDVAGIHKLMMNKEKIYI